MSIIQSAFQVFFSWQADIEDLHRQIGKDLRDAAKKVAKKLNVEIFIDEATRGEAGSPDIVAKLLEKINTCDIFVADVTPVSKIEKKDDKGNIIDVKEIPNPNVMFEL